MSQFDFAARASKQLEGIFFDCNLYIDISTFLGPKDICRLQTVSKRFNESIGSCEILWRTVARSIVSDKAFIPMICRRLLTPDNSIQRRVDLYSMSIKELKILARKYAVNITACFEKGDIISVINKRELRKKYSIESLSKFALRIAFRDASRNCIEMDELCEFNWNIRVKGDGPLGSLTPNDPWWNPDLRGAGYSLIPTPCTTTIISFKDNGHFSFLFNGPSPFQHMMADQDVTNHSYSIERGGTVVLLSFGVREMVSRHPTNWGWVLQSEGSLWTSFNMPARGVDPLLEDGEAANLLRTGGWDSGFEL